MESNVIEFPGQAEKAEARTWPERARAAVIRSVESYTTASELLLGIKALRKRIAETFDPHIARAFQSHRALTREKADAEAPLSEAERIVKEAMVAWDQEQERIRRDEQRKADEDARQREENERVIRAAAMELEGHQFGDEAMVEEAHALINEPAPVVVAAPVAKAVPKVAGISYRTVPKFRIVNPDLVPRQYCAPVDAKIRGVVTALGVKANIPGVEVYMERVVAAGGGR